MTARCEWILTKSLEPTYEGLKRKHLGKLNVVLFGFGAYLRGIETGLCLPRDHNSALSLEPTYEGLKLLDRNPTQLQRKRVWSLPTRD